jgi:antitoxin ParD1/3/4
MPTRNVVLTEHHEKVIEALVASGRYQNASEVLREGLRLVEQREAENAAKLKVLQEASQAGFDAIEQGHYRDVQADELADYIAGLGRQASSRMRNDGV